MHDIRIIRDDPSAFDRQLKRRGHEPAATGIVASDAQLRAVQTELQSALAHRNDASKAIGRAMGAGDKDEAERLKAEVAALKTRIPEMEERERVLKAELADMLAALPNHPADDVPEGLTEDDNVVVKTVGDPPRFDFDAREHDVIAAPLGLDFEAAAAISGARFAVMRGQVARLHRALGQWMLDVQTRDHGYLEANVPLLVRDEAVFGTGQLPKFSDDLFRTTDGRWLIPTAEVPLTNLVRDQIVAAETLPLRFAALTPCFRSEAGSAGRDTKGMIRQHQFEKVELVSVVAADQSEAELERKVRAAETILERLNLPYRRMLLSVGDMSATARKTIDLEVWLPGQNMYREISSISQFGDFQARRMNARMRREGEKKTEFLHTLNGSGLAVGRTLVAVLENYQRADGSVAVPEALHPYMGGVTELTPAND
ncbi:serine--tRNA ligase [Pacificimonas sp. ICDLI1SI03]